MPPRYWTCPCGTRNPRVKQKCSGEGCERRRPNKRVPAHARTLRDDPYTTFRAINEEIHGAAFGPEWQPDNCGVCGSAPKSERNMDREHGHARDGLAAGKPRGLACPGDRGCNKIMSRVTLDEARLIVAYLERVERHYSRVESGI